MTRPVPHHQSLLFGAVLLIPGSGAAFAQESAPNEQVTIEGADSIHHADREIYDRPFREVTKIAISRAVNYSDLDLSKDWGETLLTIRIKEGARHVCDEINLRYPEGIAWPKSDNTLCIVNATRDAMAAADRMVASAREPVKSVAALH
jgi:UrcA family protein